MQPLYKVASWELLHQGMVHGAAAHSFLRQWVLHQQRNAANYACFMLSCTACHNQVFWRTQTGGPWHWLTLAPPKCMQVDLRQYINELMVSTGGCAAAGFPIASCKIYPDKSYAFLEFRCAPNLAAVCLCTYMLDAAGMSPCWLCGVQ